MNPEIPATPPTLCPGCERTNCLLWRRERQRLMDRRFTVKALNFGLRYGMSASSLVDYARDLAPPKADRGA